jgi:pimeloyl-ACP methyl ester carboxylesterase
MKFFFVNSMVPIKKRSKIMKKLLTPLLFFVLFNSGYAQINALQKPSGTYSTGITYLNFTDENRKELFDNSGESNREITGKAWYPADEKSNPSPYLHNADFAIKYCMFSEIFRDLKTNSGRDLPVSSREKKYPVLVFSHGWGEHFSQNSILMEELASHGYIIFSIAHHYESKYSEYPDGRIVHIDFNSNRFQKIWREQQSPKAMELYKKMYTANTDEERMELFREIEKILPTCLKESPKYWAEDISFFLDQLITINKENIVFKNKLDLDRIGIFGMSMGGIATSEFCLANDRVKAGINIDGGLHGSILDGELHIPFLFLNGKRFSGCGKLFTEKSTEDCYSLSVKNAEHYNFTDYSVYPTPLVAQLLGTIEGSRAIEITNDIVLAFFDKYVKEIPQTDLIKAAIKYPEIEIAANIK